MLPEEGEVVVPVLREEAHVSAVPVKTGGVRVTKSIEHHEQLLEQELRKGHADVVRVKVSRLVDGPQPPFRTGNTLVIPVVSEVLQGCEKHWEVTEEIHVTQREQTEVSQQKVQLASERVRVERLDAEGNVTSVEHNATPSPVVAPGPSVVNPRQLGETPAGRLGAQSILNRRDTLVTTGAADAPNAADPPNKVLSRRRSILKRPGSR